VRINFGIKFAIYPKPTMKTNIVLIKLFIFFCLSCVTACSKNNEKALIKDITGEWNWVATYRVYTLSDSNPLTPENTGVHEKLIFNLDHTWSKTDNGIKVDSGTYSLGNGSNAPYIGAPINIYDSVLYYRLHTKSNAWDYYDIFNDTLQFCPGFAGKFASLNSFNFPDGFNGSKFWVKK
jgi:hypothetical protein